MNRSADPATTILTAGGWIGLVLFLVWQEFFVESWITSWWFRVPATVVLGLVVLVFALECLSQEMTVRRWATSVVVFGAFGALFLLAGIFDPRMMHLSRWVLLPVGAYYLLAAVVAGAGARDLF